MVTIQYANAMAEVLHFLNGIRKEDIEKIPKNLLSYLKENASKEYVCTFNYNKPLKELNLLDETRGIIGMIAYNYWCETEEQKNAYLNKLNENERRYQEELREKYNPDNLFKNRETIKQTQNENVYENNLPSKVEKNNIIKKFWEFIKTKFSKKI